MESKTKNRKSREQVARMVERAFGGASLATGENAVTELKEGWFNAAYTVQLSDGREVILKIAPPSGAEVMAYEKNIMQVEVAAMRQVRANPAIPVPEIYYYDNAHDLCDSDYFFMEKLQGVDYKSIKSSLTTEAVSKIDRQIGRIIRELNGYTGDYFGYEGNPDLRGATWRETFLKIMEATLEDGRMKNAELGYAPDALRQVLIKHAAALDEVVTPRMVHWDAWDSNFFVKEGKVSGIIDFERVLWGDPLFEAQFRALHRAGGVSESMRGYGKTSFSPTEMQRCTLYTLHLGLVMKVECYFRNYDSDYVDKIGAQLMSISMNWLEAN